MDHKSIWWHGYAMGTEWREEDVNITGRHMSEWIIHVFAVLLVIGKACSTFRAQSNPYNSTLRLIP